MKWYFEDRLQNWSKLEMLTVVLHTFVCCVRTLLIVNNRLYPRTSKNGLCRNCTVFHSDTRKSRLLAQYLLMNGLKIICPIPEWPEIKRTYGIRFWATHPEQFTAKGESSWPTELRETQLAPLAVFMTFCWRVAITWQTASNSVGLR